MHVCVYMYMQMLMCPKCVCIQSMFVYEHLTLCALVTVFTHILDQSTKRPHDQVLFVLTSTSIIATDHHLNSHSQGI